MTKFNIVTILSITTALTFMGSAMAQSDSTPVVHGIFNDARGEWQISNSGVANSTYNALTDASLTIDWVKNSSGKTIAFGFYTIDDSGNVKASSNPIGVVKSSGGRQQAYNNPNVTAQNAPEGTSWTQSFNANDVVGIWVREVTSVDAEGNVIYDTNGTYEMSNTVLYSTMIGKTSTTAGKDNDSEEGDAYTWLDKYNKDYGSDKASIGNADIIFHATSTGGPLPGVWATIALAGAASAYLRRRRKENK